MIDISKLNKTELLDLKRRIESELEDRKKFHKEDLFPYKELQIQMLEVLQDQSMYDTTANGHAVPNIVPNDICEICDYALGNYTVRNAQKPGRVKSDPRPSVYRKQMVPKNLSHLYSIMAQELTDVFLKYITMEKSAL